jgi:hypothetical protein
MPIADLDEAPDGQFRGTTTGTGRRILMPVAAQPKAQ